MIKYDYLLERKAGKINQTFLPIKSLQNLPNVAYVKGPNALGKSTLLNILALSFFGHEMSNSEIAYQLKERLESLLDTDHQQLTFNVQIDNEITGDVLFAEKSNPFSREIFLYRIVNGQRKPISPAIFNREFRLLYDIPIDPLERLPNLLNEVRSTQSIIGNKISDFRFHLQGLIKEIKDSKNPDQIENLSSQISNMRDVIFGLQNSLSEITKEYKEIRLFYLMRKWISLDETVKQEKGNIDNITGKIRTIGNNSRRVVKDHSKKQNELRTNINKAIRIKSEIKQVLRAMIQERDQARYSLWKDGDPEQEIYHPDFHNEIRVESLFFRDYLHDAYEKKSEKSREILDKVGLYKVLLQALNNYRFKETLVPGLNQPVKQFITIVQREEAKYSGEITSLENYLSCADELEELLTIVENSISIAKNLKEPVDGVRVEFENVEGLEIQKDELLQSLSIHEAEISIIEKELNPLTFKEILSYYNTLVESPDLQIYRNNTNDQLKEKLDWSKKKIEEDGELLKEKEKILSHSETELERLQKKEPHKYFSELTKIENFLQHLLHLEKKMKSNYEDYVNKAINPSRIINHSNLEEVHYYEQLGIFLGKKIGVIRHIKDKYDVECVDVFKKVIITSSGLDIKFSDLGTGQGQAAYLEALLSMNSEKKIIALFDEVAMMDENSISPIKEKLRDLYHEGKLIASIIVQKDEEESVESLI